MKPKIKAKSNKEKVGWQWWIIIICIVGVALLSQYPEFFDKLLTFKIIQ